MTLALGTDILFVLILVTFCVRGAAKGFSGEIISLIATIGGFLLAWKLSAGVSSLILPYLPLQPGATQAIALVIIYILILVAGVYAGRVVKAFLKFTHLSGIDRGMGLVAGAVKAFALLIIVYAALMALSPVLSPYWMNESVAMRLADRSWPSVQNALSSIRLLDPGSLPWHLSPSGEGESPEESEPSN
ncbi:MAG TPA: CvpA family protein [Synergistales bacterium]|nr:CvpA family protein [Synergistales bacterium]HQO82889.1 CvpA family protein [Synergistales bacterium]HQQ10362.1 CvpA family protein [Synergistales bacterium]